MKGKNVLLFLWKSLSNSLLAMDNLSRRGVYVEAVCPICRISNETVLNKNRSVLMIFINLEIIGEEK